MKILGEPMPRLRICVSFVIILFCCAGVARAQCDPAGLPARFSEVADAARERVNKGELPSLAMVIAKDGRIVCEQAFGWADLEKTVPATPHTVYVAGSVAKSVTATGAFLVAGRGKLDLDAAPERYGVTVRTYARRPMTLRQLLSMTAGVPHGWFYSYGFPVDGKQLLERYAIGAFSPGNHFNYSNFSYGIVGEVVERVAHRPFSQFLADELLRPLEMNDSGFVSPAGTSTGYEAGKPVPLHTFEPQAGGGFYTSAHDLARFGLFHLSSSQTLIPPALLKTMHTPSPGTDARSRYASGWGVLQFADGSTMLLSNGRVLGGSGTLVLLPERGIVIACLTNTATEATDEITFQLADVFSPGFLAAFDAIRKKAEAEEAPKAVATQPSLRGTWLGALEMPGKNKISVRLLISDVGQLEITVGNEKTAPVTDPRIEDGLLSGGAEVAISLPESANRASKVELQLDAAAGDQMAGVLRIELKGDPPGFGLPVFLSLRKTNTGLIDRHGPKRPPDIP